MSSVDWRKIAYLFREPSDGERTSFTSPKDAELNRSRDSARSSIFEQPALYFQHAVAAFPLRKFAVEMMAFKLT